MRFSLFFRFAGLECEGVKCGVWLHVGRCLGLEWAARPKTFKKSVKKHSGVPNNTIDTCSRSGCVGVGVGCGVWVWVWVWVGVGGCGCGWVGGCACGYSFHLLYASPHPHPPRIDTHTPTRPLTQPSYEPY